MLYVQYMLYVHVCVYVQCSSVLFQDVYVHVHVQVYVMKLPQNTFTGKTEPTCNDDRVV